MPDKHKVTLTQLRKLAREALGPEASVQDIDDDDTWTCAAASALATVRGHGSTPAVARRQLRDLLTTIISGREMESLRASYRVSSEQALKNERELRESKERHG